MRRRRHLPLRPGRRQYVFNLSTKSRCPSNMSLRVDLGDRVDHTVKVSLR
jgi:hypothetical protein